MTNRKYCRITACLLCVLSFFMFLPLESMATPGKYRNGPDPVAVMADGVVVRPLGLVSTVVGSVFYVITLPFTLPSGSEDTARQQLIEYPAWFTFQRPIGNFSHRYQKENIVQQKRQLSESLKEERAKTEQSQGQGQAPEMQPEQQPQSQGVD